MLEKVGPPAGGFGSPAGGFGPPTLSHPRLDPLAMASLGIGLFSIPGCLGQWVDIPLAATGLALGMIAFRRIRGTAGGWKGHEWAIAGIVCSAVGLLLAIGALWMPWDEAARAFVGLRA